jgi:hypothetical protein
LVTDCAALDAARMAIASVRPTDPRGMHGTEALP